VFFEVPKSLAIKGVTVSVQDLWDNRPAGEWVVQVPLRRDRPHPIG
jgi:hypothetical protein